MIPCLIAHRHLTRLLDPSCRDKCVHCPGDVAHRMFVLYKRVRCLCVSVEPLVATKSIAHRTPHIAHRTPCAEMRRRTPLSVHRIAIKLVLTGVKQEPVKWLSYNSKLGYQACSGFFLVILFFNTFLAAMSSSRSDKGTQAVCQYVTLPVCLFVTQKL